MANWSANCVKIVKWEPIWDCLGQLIDSFFALSAHFSFHTQLSDWREEFTIDKQGAKRVGLKVRQMSP